MMKQIDWKKIREGDRLVLDKMFDYYYLPLCAFVSSYVKDRQLTEDIVIDCFEKIWEERSSFEIKSSLQNYLVTVVKNSAISYLRKNHGQWSGLKKISDSMPDEMQNFAEDAEILNKLYEAINKLPEQRRNILRMAAFEEKSYSAIAGELHISVNTVKTQMTRAYKFLRSELEVSQNTIRFLLFM